MNGDPLSIERGVRQLLADKVSDNTVGQGIQTDKDGPTVFLFGCGYEPTDLLHRLDFGAKSQPSRAGTLEHGGAVLGSPAERHLGGC